MEVAAPTPCANCERLQAQVQALTATVAELQAALAQVQAQLAAARKDSSTSSKPPSSDIVKPPKPPPPPGREKRQPGDHPDHPKPGRSSFPPEALTAPAHDYSPPEIAPDCGLSLRPAGDDACVIQQMDAP